MQASRRQIISFGLAAGVGVALSGLGALLPAIPFVRPPYALAGNAFTARCMRCGACVQACPDKALAQRDLSPDFKNIGVPYLQALHGGCSAWQNGCRACAAACPSGALDAAMPIKGQRVGVARFTPSECTNCMVCLRRCPVEKAVYFPSPAGGEPWYKHNEREIPRELNTASSPAKPVIDEKLCVGCGICVAHCIPKIMRLDPL